MDEPERYYEHACDKVECKITFNYQGNSPNLYRSKLCFHSKGNSETRFKSELKKFFEHYDLGLSGSQQCHETARNFVAVCVSGKSKALLDVLWSVSSEKQLSVFHFVVCGFGNLCRNFILVFHNTTSMLLHQSSAI